MSPVRKMLDLCTDLIIFVVACFFLLRGFDKVTTMQDNLVYNLANSNLETFDVDSDLNASGDMLLAQLIATNNIGTITITTVDGTSHSSDTDLWEVSVFIDSSAEYNITRSRDGEKVNIVAVEKGY